MRRLLPLCLLACLLAAAPASASKTQPLTFEAPRDLMNPVTRPAALDELQSLGVRSLRVILTWSTVAPGADQVDDADVRADEPRRLQLGRVRPADGRREGARLVGRCMTISGPVPKWATAAKLDNLTRPSPAAFAAFTTAVGRKYGDQVSTWAIWNEPNQPQFLLPAVRQRRQGAVAADLPQRCTSPACAGCARPARRNDTILLGETSPARDRSRRRAAGASCAARCASNAKYKTRRQVRAR